MGKIWKESANIDEHPNRNNFDLRYQNHLTMKMGGIYPIMAKECVPGDSFTIDTAFGLKFMPLVFPVQSHMKAHISYFYVPNRIIWDNWKNFISGLEEHVHPYISQPKSWFKTGSLCDYMDVPTTTVGSAIRSKTSVTNTWNYHTTLTGEGNRRGVDGGNYLGNTRGSITQTDLVSTQITGLYSLPCGAPSALTVGLQWLEFVSSQAELHNGIYFYDVPLSRLDRDNCDFYFEGFNLPYGSQMTLAFWSKDSHGTEIWRARCLGKTSVDVEATNGFWRVPLADLDDSLVYTVSQAQEDGKAVYVSLIYDSTLEESFGEPQSIPTKTASSYFSGRFRYTYKDTNIDINDLDTPFANDIEGQEGEPVIRLNALPFRAYEAVYWSYFSNTQNQQFVVDGQPVYNKWNTTTADGADTTPYHLFYRNYEMDFLTSAMPSPQFGVAPLVGMTALGNITIEDENGISTYHATVDNDGTITKVVATSPTASIEHARTAMNIAQVGMNINDFRATNSFQRFLETTLRKGYRYKDFIMGHHGVDVKQIELDMPVYIGGVSQDVSVNLVSNMSAGQSFSDGQPIPLGEFAGTANCFGQSQNTITHYCDDYGWIIGVLTVVPDPAYSQLLPKHYLHDKQMSYYFNEFAQNGMQPITYREVTPLTAYQDSLVDPSKLLTDTFAYQRPNYDLVGYTDQVHGLFRTDLKDFLIHRIFSHRPELGTEFLEIDPKEVNDIFAYRDADADTILGQIIVDVKAKRPVPRVVVPSLGR